MLLAAAGLTALMFAVSGYYYVLGRKLGHEEAMSVVKEFEPKAFNRLHGKLRKIVDAE